ncbi:phosphate ABC transporter substrate-binding protein [Paenibacillus eucommiae]|uniref:Phosphate-binding protein n=1 Tax=Paenibacillus eucommiae TaxID=1355755 RepID=A0ABS4IQK2_9BACL|nr:phosphate ABC transporter substrate-binding protein [Paenibacillus eucommiae]MBP1989425.1 phosphate transport system substrate-binding protein [Paenibacillus eucommiae]
MSKFISKKGLAIVFCAIMLMGVLAGCGKAKEDENAASPTPSASTEATASPSPSASTTPAGEELSGTITTSGSSALLPMVKQAATDFMDLHPKVSVSATAGGSGKGVKDVADGNSDIGNSDVEYSAEYNDKGLVDHIVSIAPFALIVNKDVTVDNLTKQQAADIFTGKVTNWKEVGGSDLKITLIQRPDGSGSRKLVQKLVLDGAEFTKDGITQENSGAMRTAVSQTAGAIGYIDTPYVDESLKALKMEGVEPTEENIKNGSYTLYGVEHMYTKGEATGITKAFIDFILSKEFQENQVRELGFLPADILKK